MKLLLIAHDIPYPPMHGGRVDIWRRIKLFSEMGFEVALLTWTYGNTSRNDLERLLRHVTTLKVLPIAKTLRYRLPRLVRLGTLPLYELIRWPGSREWKKVIRWAEAYAPDAIWLDGLYGGFVALKLSNRLGLELFYRSHNIEWQYLKALRVETSSIRGKCAAFVGEWHLRAFEMEVATKAACVFEISNDNVAYWSNVGCRRSVWLPPLIESVGTDEVPEKFDIVFLGNLHVSNNKAGVQWLIRDVMPKLWAKAPGATLLIAGSNPSPEISELIDQCDGRVTLEENPKDSMAVLRSGRVLINPMRRGSGVSIKTLDMMSTGKPLICTSQAVSGLHASTRAQVIVCDELGDIVNALYDVLCSGSKEEFGGYDLLPYSKSSVKDRLLDALA